MTTDISAILAEREKTHGNYEIHAAITQDLKRVMRNHVCDLDRRLDDDMQESLDMIAHKIGRIIAGNAAEPEHWRDIAGYAQLVVNRLEGGND